MRNFQHHPVLKWQLDTDKSNTEKNEYAIDFCNVKYSDSE